MIRIVLTNGKIFEWHKEEFDDYKYDGKFFIIVHKGEWVGFYNLDHVISIVVKKEDSDVGAD